MPTSKDSLKERLTRYRQIKIGVIGRRENNLDTRLVRVGRPEGLPLDSAGLGDAVVQDRTALSRDSDEARGVVAEVKAVPITDAKTVKSAIEKFREKYGARDVKNYYSKFDVAVVVQLT